ncbi:prion-inhibition and propagation-domain-containing protein [Lineolata rhizophorae]|uniref:Prion-inhibition and propagation-domain-containing protein n=1 Tax=Lineolata rhizophorae TaxID=578093 RepID=A0A6A6NRS2_9PEZI|nr:prion-inhibition and propagation-domain-containing protein [Lineolata rhizophorae]
MGEPVGAVLGAVGLAGLFTSCVEAFGYFKATQTLDADLDILLVKLDIEKAKLLVWGNAVGILEEEWHRRITQALSTESLEKCLKSIEKLLTDSDELRRTYGVKISDSPADRAIDIVSSISMSIFKRASAKFWVRRASKRPGHTILSRTKWAIYDHRRFEKLITDLKDLIDGLQICIPLDVGTQDNTIAADIQSIEDLSQLKLVEAATEGSYRTYSEAARTAITESEMGTIADVETRPSRVGLTVEAAATSSAPNFDFVQKLTYGATIFTVLTGKCHKLDSSEPCDTAQFGSQCFMSKRISDASMLSPKLSHDVAAYNHFSTNMLHDRIKSAINIPSRLSEMDYKQQEAIQRIMAESDGQSTTQQEMLDLLVPIANAYVHCAPCICLLHTALRLSASASSTLLRFFVRPDDRLTASCCHNAGRAESLTSLLNEIDDYESDIFQYPTTHRGIRYLDRSWIERRLRQMEFEEDYDEYREDFKPIVVVLGEVEHTLPLLQNAHTPAIPKEGEIWKLSKNAEGYVRKFLFSYSRKKRSFGGSPTTNDPVGVQKRGLDQSFSRSHGRYSTPESSSSKRKKVTHELLDDQTNDESAEDDEDDEESTKGGQAMF